VPDLSFAQDAQDMTSETPQDLSPSPPADKVHITITRGQLSSLANLLDSYYYAKLPKLSGVDAIEIEITNEFINNFVTFCKTDDRLFTLLVEAEGFAEVISRIKRDDFAEKFGILNPNFKEGISQAIREIEIEVKQLRSEAQEYKRLLDQIDHDFNVRGDPVRSALRYVGALNPLGFLVKSVSSCISAYRNFIEIEQTRGKRTDILAKIRDLRNILRLIPVV
jgi:hypothetical protein